MSTGDSFLDPPFGKDYTTDTRPENRQNLRKLSPYLNFDPDYIPKSQPEFIFLDNTTHVRGRFELAFSQIGASCAIGAILGGGGGLYDGIKNTTHLGHSPTLRRTQVINYIVKQGAARANTLGTLAVLYSGFGVLLTKLRGHDDELNTITAGTATGLFYKSTSGLRKCGIGGAVGLVLSTVYCLITSGHKLFGMI
ncbi:UNVERIFIED_CONTAM: hypothetical protein PYX00_008700 [Menopon gallinae]|uniref:Mitochondrial import inner membrane translocase subunit Tim23 n=1 Tax=Menopon gallinae TaxID=328185 RepID=A0AAW2HNX0_9NEOP